MILLNGTTQYLQASMAGSASTTQPSWFVSYVDINTIALVQAANTSGALAGTSPVTLLQGTTDQLKISSISIYNGDTATQTITVWVSVSSTDRYLYQAILNPGDSIHYEDAEGWYVTLASGAFSGQGTQGSTGIRGPTGPSAGPQGVTGLQGPTGLSLQGQTGLPGPTGAQGLVGPTGAYGGPQGATGIQGITGIGGSIGFQGATGVQGPTGQGATGVQGATGIQGQEGTTGFQGAQGTTGFQGATGVPFPPNIVASPTAVVGTATGLGATTGVTNSTLYTSCSITVTGNHPVLLTFAGENDVDSTSGLFSYAFVGGNDSIANYTITRDGVAIGKTQSESFYSAGSLNLTYPVTTFVDPAPSAGSHTYAVYLDSDNNNSPNATIKFRLIAQEIGGSAQGATGIAGNAGATGLQGAQGVTGLQGLTGLQGITGLGVTGPAGGPQGATGPQGNTGVRGYTGLGATGVQGTTGLQGPTGSMGSANWIISATGVETYFPPNGSTGVCAATGQLVSVSNGARPNRLSLVTNTINGQLFEVDPLSDLVVDFYNYGTLVGGLTYQVGATYSDSAGSPTGVAVRTTLSPFEVIDLHPTGVNNYSVQVVQSGGSYTGISFAQLFVEELGGPQGVTGVQGVTGPAAGPQGATGLQGATGIQGTTGNQGTTGAGSQGATGLTGPTGVQGQTGAGTQGATGVSGSTGPSGGPVGATGVQGATGVAGATGLQGAGGSQGTTGAQGQTGVQGQTGLQGATGVSIFSLPASGFTQYDDFLTGDWNTGVYNGGFSLYLKEVGTSFATSNVSGTSDSGHPGQVECSMSIASSNYWILAQSQTFELGGGTVTFEIDVFFGSATMTAGTLYFGAGLTNIGVATAPTLGANFANGVWLSYARTTNTTTAGLTINTSASSTATNTSTGNTVTLAAWNKLGFVVNAAASSVTFYLNGVSQGSITSNIPTAGLGTTVFAGCSTGVTGSGSQGMFIDYMYLNNVLTSSR